MTYQNEKSLEKKQSMLLKNLLIGIFLVLVLSRLSMFIKESNSETASLIRRSTNEAVVQTKSVLSWVGHEYGQIMWPLCCGVAVIVFASMITYLDSDIPGVSPPGPFAGKGHPLDPNYVFALASGAAVAGIMYFS